jgi:hypothetical protein
MEQFCLKLNNKKVVVDHPAFDKCTLVWLDKLLHVQS